jgi:RNA polymerase sigma-70 factor (ECF subfamily)
MSAAPDMSQRQADTRALAAAFREHADFVRRSLARLGVPQHSLDDALQDVFVVAVRRIHEFEGRAKLRTWLFAIAQRVTQRKQRDAFRHRRRIGAMSEAHAGTEPQADEGARRDAVRTLAALLEQLDEEFRMLFVLVELEGMSVVEVARSLDANVNTVHSRLRRARKQMREAAARMQAEDTSSGGRA